MPCIVLELPIPDEYDECKDNNKAERTTDQQQNHQTHPPKSDFLSFLRAQESAQNYCLEWEKDGTTNKLLL